jgi:hypothetical protein
VKKETYVCNICRNEVGRGCSLLPMYGLVFSSPNGEIKRDRPDMADTHICGVCLGWLAKIHQGLPKLSDDHK